MIGIDPESNSERENYKLLIGSIIPRPIAFVTSQSAEGVLNGAPFSYFNVVSSNPPLISISVQRKNGKRKDTSRNIHHLKEFVVHAVDEENVNLVNETAASIPENESEIELAKLTSVNSELISVPGVVESKFRMECVLEEMIELGGDEKTGPGADLIIGKVVRFHVDENIFCDGKIDPRELGAVSRLAGNDYANIGRIFSKKRPD